MFVAKLELCLLALIDSGDPLGHCHVHDEQLSIYLASGQCIQAKCMGEGAHWGIVLLGRKGRGDQVSLERVEGDGANDGKRLKHFSTLGCCDACWLMTNGTDGVHGPQKVWQAKERDPIKFAIGQERWGQLGKEGADALWEIIWDWFWHRWEGFNIRIDGGLIGRHQAAILRPTNLSEILENTGILLSDGLVEDMRINVRKGCYIIWGWQQIDRY